MRSGLHLLISGFADFAPLNIPSIFVTFFTFHLLTSGFANSAPLNIPLRFCAFFIFHLLTFGFTRYDDENISLKLLMFPVSQFAKLSPSSGILICAKALEASVTSLTSNFSSPLILPPSSLLSQKALNIPLISEGALTLARNFISMYLSAGAQYN